MNDYEILNAQLQLLVEIKQLKQEREKCCKVAAKSPPVFKPFKPTVLKKPIIKMSEPKYIEPSKRLSAMGMQTKIIFAFILQASITAFLLSAFIVIAKISDLNLILFLPLYFLAVLAFASVAVCIVFCMLYILFKKSKATIILSVMLGLFVTLLGFVFLNHYDPLVLKQRVITSLITGASTLLFAVLMFGLNCLYNRIYGYQHRLKKAKAEYSEQKVLYENAKKEYEESLKSYVSSLMELEKTNALEALQYNDEVLKRQNEFKKEQDEAKQRAEQLSCDITALLEKLDQTNGIPRRYQSIKTLTSLKAFFDNKQATTIKDAFTLLLRQ